MLGAYGKGYVIGYVIGGWGGGGGAVAMRVGIDRQ